ncbi:MAG: hypothetical protein WAV20_05965 [Blastocatellia bacterium]
MHKLRQSVALTIVFALIGLSVAQAQIDSRYRRDDRQIGEVLTRIQQRTVRFQNSIRQAVTGTRMDNTQREVRINTLIADFQEATAQLRSRFLRRQATETDVRTVLERAAPIDAFVQRRQAVESAQTDWRLVRDDLDRLARAYNLEWNWETVDTRDPDVPRGPGSAARLSGTFRLNTASSDNARLIVDRAVRSLSYSERQRASEMLLRRVDAPEMLAIDRNGRMITLASSRAPQMTFEADGQEHVEQYPNSQRTSRVIANLVGDQLTITSSGDRATDFSVTFDPINNGRQLRVTRRLSSDRLSQEIVVNSIYDQTSNVARWDVYTGTPGYPRNDPRDAGRYTDFIVPDGTVLVARLKETLDTTRVRSGDRFTLDVLSPFEYRDATIEGHVADVNRSGRVTGRAELALNFDSIRLRNGRTGRFEGILESVRTPNNEDLRIDTEGTVAEDKSQTGRTVERAAIGTAIGAIIGAIAGGGKGAAVGAVVGAGAGAGTVFAQGRNDLQLTSGSEITIRATAPNRRAAR